MFRFPTDGREGQETPAIGFSQLVDLPLRSTKTGDTHPRHGM